MLLLATQALPQMREYAHPNLGRLVTPANSPVYTRRWQTDGQ
jgi:hypothetical protein